MSDKIRPQHTARKAILYIRQSSAYQVTHNVESQKLQYAMEDRLQHLGWREIEVVDEDLGRSASGAVTRTGFERMVAQVCMGQVGAVAAREVSRFARNSREWQQLVEVCRVVDTVLIDQETVYTPRQSNDRLLLGLKGSLNEYELDLLRQRSWEARREKARRGELIVSAPVGFIKTDQQRLEKDPDRRVQQAIQLVYSKFVEIGSVRQTLLWFLEHDLELPVHDAQGQTHWKRPYYGTVYKMLTHPAYGGAYVYGRREKLMDYTNGQPRQSHRKKPRSQWLSLIPNNHEGYVSWEQFEKIRTMIQDNNRGPGKTGAIQSGPALLGGLLRCRRCGRKLMINYTGNHHDVVRYVCDRGWMDNGAPRCIAFGGITVDEAMATEILRRNYLEIYDMMPWRECRMLRLVSATGGSIVTLPKEFDSVLDVRQEDALSQMFPADMNFFFNIDPTFFDTDNVGTPTHYVTLPNVATPVQPQGEFVSFVSDSPNDKSIIFVRGELNGVEQFETLLLNGTTPVTTTLTYDTLLVVGKEITTGKITIQGASTNTLLDVYLSDTRARSHVRFMLFRNAGQDLNLLVHGKRKVIPLRHLHDKPMIRGAGQALVYMTVAELAPLLGADTAPLAATYGPKAEAAVKKLVDRELKGSASKTRIVPLVTDFNGRVR